MTTSFRKSVERSATIVLTLAPRTFLIPISFIRWLMAKAESPNKPRHAMNMAMQAKMVKIFACLCSAWYSLSKFSSRKVYDKVFQEVFFSMCFRDVIMRREYYCLKTSSINCYNNSKMAETSQAQAARSTGACFQNENL